MACGHIISIVCVIFWLQVFQVIVLAMHLRVCRVGPPTILCGARTLWDILDVTCICLDRVYTEIAVGFENKRWSLCKGGFCSGDRVSPPRVYFY